MRLSRAQKPDPRAAVDSLYRRYGGDVYRYALAIMADAGDAEDVTQTTFLNAFRAIERGEQIREPKAWLRTIAHNVCRQRFRQVARQPSQVPFDEDVGELVADHDGPTAEDLTRALKHLPFNQRSALVMRELEGRSPREIAEQLGVTLSATETLLFRARRGLREQMEGSLSCRQAEQAISRQADGMLGRSERGALRAHLRECPECARAAKSIRARRGAMRSLAATPLPPALGLASSFGNSTGGAAVVGSVLGKLAIGGATAALVAGGGVAAISAHPWHVRDAPRPPAAHHALPSAQRPAPTPVAAPAGVRLTSGSANAQHPLAARRARPASPARWTSAKSHRGKNPGRAVTKTAKRQAPKQKAAKTPNQHAAKARNPHPTKPSKNPKVPAPSNPRSIKPAKGVHGPKPSKQHEPDAGTPQGAATEHPAVRRVPRADVPGKGVVK